MKTKPIMMNIGERSMREMKDKINTILWIGIHYILPILIAIGFAVFYIVVFFKYGNTPPEETPNWVRWVMWKSCR